MPIQSYALNAKSFWYVDFLIIINAEIFVETWSILSDFCDY